MPWKKSSTIWFKSSACLPTALLTPEASYITIMANTAVIANSVDANPLSNPTSIDKHVTNELCELGIPPEIIILLKSNFFSFPVNIFRNCAKKQENILISKILF